VNNTGPGTIERLLILLAIMAATIAPLAIAVVAGLVAGSLLVGVAALVLEIAVVGLVIRRKRRIASA